MLRILEDLSLYALIEDFELCFGQADVLVSVLLMLGGVSTVDVAETSMMSFNSKRGTKRVVASKT